MRWQDAEWPQVDVLIEPLPERKNHVASRDMVWDGRCPNRPEVDRVECFEPIVCILTEHALGLQIELAATRELREVQLDVAAARDPLNGGDTRRNDLAADPVTGNHCDSEGGFRPRHFAILR